MSFEEGGIGIKYAGTGAYDRYEQGGSCRSSGRSTSAQNRPFNAIPRNSVTRTCPRLPANTTLGMNHESLAKLISDDVNG